MLSTPPERCARSADAGRAGRTMRGLSWTIAFTCYAAAAGAQPVVAPAQADSTEPTTPSAPLSSEPAESSPPPATDAPSPEAGSVESPTPSEAAPPAGPGATEPASAPNPVAAPGPVEVTVRGESRAARRRKSAEAVTVVELTKAKHEAADLGQVLARTEGISVRRGGGLGSPTRLSLNGLVDDQIRFFLDGIPLEYQGYTYGIGNVPVNLFDRVEVFAGVVPVRYGADALGGAVDLRTDPAVLGTRASGSYEVGSFGTLRLTASGRHLFEPTGLFVNLNGFVDGTRNDYTVDDVLVASDDGSERPVRAERFHDDYRAAGGNVEVGIVNRPWARRLLARAYYTGFKQDVQSNPPMTIAYGGVTYAERTMGGSIRYENRFGKVVALRAVTGYAHQHGRFLDVDRCVWNWLGQCVRQSVPGETDVDPHDQINRDHSVYGRYEVAVDPAEGHAVRLAVAPTYFRRKGDERYDRSDEIDELNSLRSMTGLVGGAEYELDALEERLENIAFAKLYFQRVGNEEVVPGGTIDRRERTLRGGGGNAFRASLIKVLYAKVSYEYATRLPSPEEIFGDNVFIDQQLEELLRPEMSHNGNVSVVLDVPQGRFGALRAAANGFVRSVRDLIVRLGFERGTSYQNVATVRSMGVEGVVDWTSPGEIVALGGNVTYMDFTNLSRKGTFQKYRGDRIPNRPYLLANASARLTLRDLFAKRDEAWLSSYTSYVHSFWLGWESIGSLDSRLTVPSQLVETLALGYLRRISDTKVTATVEAQNVADARVSDFFGSQRPGRAFYLKTTIEH